jgi:hypothetical protein
MKLSRLTCTLAATGLAFALLQGNGSPTAAGDKSRLRILSGTYSSLFSGYVVGNNPLQPFAGTGLFISDGKGNLRGHETANFDGHDCEYRIKGTYTIAADGSGSNAIDFFDGGPGCQDGSYTQSFEVVDDGDLILLSNTNSPDVGTEHWYRAGARSEGH